MSKLTRRGFLGAGGGGLVGLAACGQSSVSDPQPEARVLINPDNRPGYPGSVSFIHGLASGDPLPDRVILWTRVTPAETDADADIPVSYGVFLDPEMNEPVAYGEATATAARDYTVKVDAGDLKPDTVYYYRFIAKMTTGEVASEIGRTKTTAIGGDAPVKLAVVSCSNFPFGRFHVYRAISQIEGLDAIVHLGDYLYEYGVDGYGAEIGKAIGRNHDPITEIISLGDYRLRHAQYRSDPDLQAAHAAAPWICTWDDHESTNNSYRSGAENHNPENQEGNWTDRKQVAVQAYLEWMPVRDPQPGLARESIYRKFEFGDVASIICLESRLTGRSDEISWFQELAGTAPADVPMKALSTMTRVNDPARTMLGDVQEVWLDNALTGSTQKGTSWQVLANQVVMARVNMPNLSSALTPEQIAAQDVGYVQQMIPFSMLGQPLNLDAWDGFPAARDRLYASAKAAGARLVTLTGDTHTAWANTLLDGEGEQRGVEFGCTSVTSPGLHTYFRAIESDDLGAIFAEANSEVEWYDPAGNGWTEVTLTRENVVADYYKVSDVKVETFTSERVKTVSATAIDGGVSPLTLDS